MSRRVPLVLLLVPLLAACFEDVSTAFPMGLEPLEDNVVELPAGTADDPYPAGWEIETAEAARWDTVYLRGYIHAPPADVLEAFRDPNVGTDARSADEWTFEYPEDTGEYDDLYLVHSTTYDIITVNWTTEFRYGVIEGTLEDPLFVAIRWQKIEGSSILRVIEGSTCCARPTIRTSPRSTSSTARRPPARASTSSWSTSWTAWPT